MSTAYATVLALLPRLSQQELAAVRATAEQLQLPTEEQAGPLFEAVRHTLNSKLPYSRFKLSRTYKEWAKHEPEIMLFVANLWPGISKIQEQALLRYLIAMLATYITSKKVPVTVGTITSFLPQLPACFDNAFPGYRATGLAPLILKAMMSAP